MSRQDACVELISASLLEGVKKSFLLPIFRKEVMPVRLYNAMQQALLLMEISFSELIQLAMFIIALVALVKNCNRK